MKGWPCVALAWVGVVCLLLGLCPQDAVTGPNSHQRIACCARSVGPWGEPAQASHTAAPTAMSPAPGEPRAGPLESLTAPLVLSTERDVSPPSFDTRGPPGSVQAALVNCWAAGEAGSPKQWEAYASPTKSMRPDQAPRQKTGFCNSL